MLFLLKVLVVCWLIELNLAFQSVVEYIGTYHHHQFRLQSNQQQHKDRQYKQMLYRYINIIKSSTNNDKPSVNYALSDKYMENDLVAIQRSISNESPPRLCVVTNTGGVIPLCRRQDDVDTDLFADPRITYTDLFWINSINTVHDTNVAFDGRIFGEGFYGQRPVPSLGGGPGYGALADEVWSISEVLLDEIITTCGVDLPTIDVGIAHGEKARGGSIG